MKKSLAPLRFVSTFVAACLSAQAVSGALVTWTNAAGGNWSVSGNWSPNTVPGTAEDVRFGNNATGAQNNNDITSEVINSLIYNQNNQAQQTTLISLGKTVSVIGSGAAGTVLFGVDSGTSAPIAVPAAITGTGGKLTLNGAGNIVVRQCNGASGAQMGTLDLSGLDAFTATAGRLLVGQAGASPDLNRPSGTLILAKTNTITLNGGAPQVIVQDAAVNANGSTASVLTFGQVNFLNAATWRLAGQKGNANVNFNGAFSSPSLTIRGADGVSPCTVIDFGYNAAVSTGNSTTCNADFSLGSVNILSTLINVPQGPIGTGTGTAAGTLTLGAGTVNATTFELGYGNATGASGTTTGTVNVNNNGLFASGALLQAGTLRLARTNGGSATVTGTLNINGGTVQAGTIIAGGGVSVINISSSGKLVLTNTAGTLSSPIRSLSIADTTLQIPALNGGAVIAVSNLTVGGSANTINIASIPPIGSYPADFTLINYLNGYTAGTGPVSLGSLPPGSPAYSGSLVDAGGGVIKLHLTAGPVAVLGMRWTGATDNNWDLSTYNWTFSAIATNYFDGSAPLFDDGTSQSNINLTTALSPGSITVSNNTLQYSFIGSGNIAGAGTLTKKGSSSLIVANQGIDTIGTVVISGGTLQIGTNDLNGTLSAVSITNNSALIVNRSGTLTLSSAIVGTGTLTKTGDGTLILSGANNYSGATALSAGTLQVDQPTSGNGSLSTSPGTVLSGSGTVNGPVTVGGQLNPGAAGAPGTFKAHGGLTLTGGSTLAFDLSATDPSNPAANDSVEVIGNLVANNNVITVTIAGTPQTGASYTLFTYTGSLIGNFNATIAGTHFAAVLDTSTPGLVNLNITGSSGADLEWASTSDNSWDLNTPNWLNLNNSTPSLFLAGDTVLLDDANGVTTTLTIPAGLTVYPSLFTNNSTNNSYMVNGAGRIGGATGIVKAGPSTLIVATANTFTGPVDVQDGTLITGNGSALGTAGAGTTVEDGATLDLNGQNIGGELITISGAGVNGAGALVNNGAGQAQALRQLILASDATIGGAGLLGINNSGGAASLSTGGNPFSLAKVGVSQLTLQNLALDPALGNIDIQLGTIEFSSLTSTMGDPAYTNSVQAGATLSIAGNSVSWNKHFVFNGNGSTTTFNNGASASTELIGPVELHGNCVFNIGGTLLTISGALTGDGGLIKNGGSPMVLNNTNTYTGDTRINTAALRLNGNGSISNSPNIVIAAGATLTVTGRVDATFTLANGQILKGNGSVNGFVIESAGSTIAPGLDAIGALAVSNAVTLHGTTTMELDEANGTNDVLRSNSSITYGGTLNLINLGGPLTTGSSFKLFSASSYPGSFSSINPSTPGPGQTWDVSALGTSGIIRVGAQPQPRISAFAIYGNNLALSGTNGTPSSAYYVLASTNIALPRANWTRIATNSFDSSGNFTFTNTISPSVPQRYFTIQLP